MMQSEKVSIVNYLSQIKGLLPLWLQENPSEVQDIMAELEEHILDAAQNLAGDNPIDDDILAQAILQFGTPESIANEYRAIRKEPVSDVVLQTTLKPQTPLTTQPKMKFLKYHDDSYYMVHSSFGKIHWKWPFSRKPQIGLGLFLVIIGLMSIYGGYNHSFLPFFGIINIIDGISRFWQLKKNGMSKITLYSLLGARVFLLLLSLIVSFIVGLPVVVQLLYLIAILYNITRYIRIHRLNKPLSSEKTLHWPYNHTLQLAWGIVLIIIGFMVHGSDERCEALVMFCVFLIFNGLSRIWQFKHTDLRPVSYYAILILRIFCDLMCMAILSVYFNDFTVVPAGLFILPIIHGIMRIVSIRSIARLKKKQQIR